MKILTIIFLSQVLTHDIAIKDIKFKGLKSKGDDKFIYQKIDKYDPYSGEVPEWLDVYVTVENKGNSPVKNLEIRLVVSAKVGFLIGSKEVSDMLDQDATRKNAVWLSPDIIIKKKIDKINPHKTIEIKFEKVNIKQFNKEYWEKVNKEYAVTDLKFEATVNPQREEASLKNNIFIKYFPITLGD